MNIAENGFIEVQRASDFLQAQSNFKSITNVVDLSVCTVYNIKKRPHRGTNIQKTSSGRVKKRGN